MKNKILPLTCFTISLSFLFTYSAITQAAEVNSAWSYWGATKAFNRYSPAAQIYAENVSELKILWRRPAVDSSIMRAYPELRVSGNLRSTPILIDGVLYAINVWKHVIYAIPKQEFVADKFLFLI